NSCTSNCALESACPESASSTEALIVLVVARDGAPDPATVKRQKSTTKTAGAARARFIETPIRHRPFSGAKWRVVGERRTNLSHEFCATQSLRDLRQVRSCFESFTNS